jgi:hypothetical protein
MVKVGVPSEPIDLREILRRLNPNIPAGLDASAIPRTARDSAAVRQLRTLLLADPYAKSLLTGHIGVGKSTELLQLCRDLESERFVVWCSLAQSLGVHNTRTFSLLIVILEAMIRAWTTQLGGIPPGLAERLSAEAESLLETKRPARITITGRRLLDTYAHILRVLALEHRGPRAMLAKREVEPLVHSCEVVTKELENKATKPVLLVIDDLDKVRDEETQHELFIDRAGAWMRLPCGVLATLPLDGLFTQRGRELDHVWGEIGILDPLPVPEPQSPSTEEEWEVRNRAPRWQPLKDPNLQPYLGMLRSVGGHRAFSALQCRQLAYLSSGVPRAFIHACAACAAYALDAGDNHIREHHVALVQHAMTDRWRGRLTDSDYAAIVDVLDSGGANVPRAIQSVRDGLLIRDGNAAPDRQFRLAAWAEPLVDAYRKRCPSAKAVHP